MVNLDGRYFRLWALDGEPSPANPAEGWDDIDDAESAAPFNKPSESHENIRRGIITIGVVVKRAR